MSKPNLKDKKREVVEIVERVLRAEYDRFKTPDMRQDVTRADNSIRVRFAEYPNDAPIYVRVDIRGEP